MWWIFLLGAKAAIVAYAVYKLFVFARADADLTVLSKTLKRSYFDGKVVWVTGASSGIGEALCYQLSKCGARLILSARSVDKLERLREQLASPENARVFHLDLEDEERLSTAVQEAEELFGRIDCLVNNAGMSMRAMFLEMDEEVDRRIMQVDYNAPRAMTKAVLPGMISRGFGHIVNISSMAGKMALPLRSSYAAAKHAIIGMMDGIRLELVGKNIHITNVCPGFVQTNAAKNALLKDGSQFGKTNQFIAQGMTVERCAHLILVAVSNQLRETWPIQQPYLLYTSLAQYMPSVFWFVQERQAQAMVRGSVDE